MSTLECPVIPVVLTRHPNADSLSIVKVFGWQVIVKTENFQNVSLAAYIPVDSMLSNNKEFEGFPQKRVKSIKLRGIYSEGILIPARPHWKLGENVAEELGITKYEPPEPIMMQTEDCSAPNGFHIYTEIENFRRYPNKFIAGEEVVLSEKLEGANFRAIYTNNQLYVGSHRNCKKRDERNLWWKVAIKYNLEEKLDRVPDHLVFGEVFGQVGGFSYGGKTNELFLAIFDIFTGNRYLDYDEFASIAKSIDIPTAPLIYRGPWNPSLISLAEGNSLWPGANNIREGIVIRPTKERYDPEIKRVILKVVSQQYLLRKGGK